MLIRITRVKTTPLITATQLVRGGLVYSRRGRPGLVELATSGADYYRSLEWGPRPLKRWKTPRQNRYDRPARRIVRFQGIPQLKPRDHIPPREPPNGLSILLDPEEETAARWESHFIRAGVVLSPAGYSLPRVARVSPDWDEWLAHRSPKYRAWPTRVARYPTRGGDPVEGFRKWIASGGVSPLRGLRSSSDRLGSLQTRLSRLNRRRRDYLVLENHLDRRGEYLFHHWGRTRRKLEYRARRFQLFQRRRIRPYLFDLPQRENYIGGTTRTPFFRVHPNRWARIERANLLGGAYIEEHARRVLLTRKAPRIRIPLEYSLYNPLSGFLRVSKRLRSSTRRVKLGKQPLWGEPFRAARAARWSWFGNTPLGALLGRAPGVVPPEGGLGGGLSESVYWGTRRWGRGRWPERPRPGRGVHNFVTTLKGGTTVEGSATQWGEAGASGVGVFLSLVGEFELRQLYGQIPQRPSWMIRTMTTAQALVTRFVNPVVNLFIFTIYHLFSFFWWWIFTPVWWVYSILGRVICYSLWWVRRLWWFLYALFYAVFEFLSWLTWHGTTRPFLAYGIHYLKDTHFVKAVAWVYTSWLLIYSSGDDQIENEVPTIQTLEETSHEDFFNDLYETGDHSSDFDALDEGLTAGYQRPNLNQGTWNHNVNDAWDTFIETVADFLTEEVPYWVGLLFQPLIDWTLRLPGWAVLEGASLLWLTVRLESQRNWVRLLGRPGGRWWKIPLILVRWLIGVIWWVGMVSLVGTSLSYETLYEATLAWGIPWREDFYLLWWGLTAGMVTYWTGPRWIVSHLKEIGWGNLVGVLFGTTEVALPEEYYPSRPDVGVIERELHRVGEFHLFRKSTLDTLYPQFREDIGGIGSRTNAVGYDELRVVLAKYYQLGEAQHHREEDEEHYPVLPIHLTHTADTHLSKAGQVGWFNTRAEREPRLLRNNVYYLPFEHTTGGNAPFGWVGYEQEDNSDTETLGEVFRERTIYPGGVEHDDNPPE